MEAKEMHDNAKEYIINKIHELKYPDGHPFLQAPSALNCNILELWIILKYLLNDNDIIFNDLLKKCKSESKGKFDREVFNQNMSEVNVLYYILVGLRMLNNTKNRLGAVLYEGEGVINNKKKLEYSFLMMGNENISDLINFEVKTITCDPLLKEKNIKIKDGQVLLKPFYPNLDLNSSVTSLYKEPIVLKNSTHFNQIKKNLRKIIEKFEGENRTSYNLINIGVIVINYSTSMEEFYSYLYNEEKGLINTIDFKNLHALVLFTLDAKNDLLFNNLYSTGYVQTLLIKDCPKIRNYLSLMRFDNYMSFGNRAYCKVLDSAKKEYGAYKVLAREGFLTFVPYESSEEEIQKYIQYLKGTEVRYFL